jgi:hypothetical protein
MQLREKRLYVFFFVPNNSRASIPVSKIIQSLKKYAYLRSPYVESGGCGVVTIGANRSTRGGSAKKRSCFEFHQSVNLSRVRWPIDIYLLAHTKTTPRLR